MLIKITDKCNMGCSHCLSDCTPNLHDMKLKTFIDAMKFHDKYCLTRPILISGGEPTESSIFLDVIEYLTDNKTVAPVTITTNGLWLTQNEWLVQEVETYFPPCTFQIVVDDRYYPTHVDESSPIFKHKNVMLCRDVMQIYPQGRALTNNLPFRAKASKCFNVRAITKQIPNVTLSALFNTLNVNAKFCTPHIDIDGNIKLGESRLCPVCSSIYKSEEEIIEDIINFKCHQCDFINDKLPDLYKRFVE